MKRHTERNTLVKVDWFTCTYFRIFLSQPMKFSHGPRQLAEFLSEGPSRWQRSNQRNVNKRKSTLSFAPNSAFRDPVTSVLPSILCCPRDFSPVLMLVLYIHSTLAFVTALDWVSAPSYQNPVHCSRPSSRIIP